MSNTEFEQLLRELELFLKPLNWSIVQRFFDIRIKQEIVDLVQNAQSLTLEQLRDANQRIECYREFGNLPSLAIDVKKANSSRSDVKRR